YDRILPALGEGACCDDFGFRRTLRLVGFSRTAQPRLAQACSLSEPGYNTKNRTTVPNQRGGSNGDSHDGKSPCDGQDREFTRSVQCPTRPVAGRQGSPPRDQRRGGGHGSNDALVTETPY